MNKSQKYEPYEHARAALLRYYNSQCMTHGGYLIALVIGLLTIISNWTNFKDVIPLFYITVFFLITLCGYIIYRIFWWGYFASTILHVGKKEIEEEKKQRKERNNQVPMSILHCATTTQVRNTNVLTSLFEKYTGKIIKWTSRKLQKLVLSEGFYCSYCGTRNVKDAVYCKHCGKKMVEVIA